MPSVNPPGGPHPRCRDNRRGEHPAECCPDGGSAERRGKRQGQRKGERQAEPYPGRAAERRGGPHRGRAAEFTGADIGGLPRRRKWRGGFDQAGLGVPIQAHPLLAPTDWAELSRPGSPLHWVVVNVSAGPGVRPDPLVMDATARLREYGVRLLGYLDTAYTRRTCGALLPQASHHLDWYAVDGFFLDRVPLDEAELPHYRRTVSTLRALTGGGHMVLRHGAHPDPGYAAVADQLVTFDGGWSAYQWAEPPEWTRDFPPEHFCHLVDGVPRRHLEDTLELARRRRAATVCLTDRTGEDAWAGLPGYWPEMIRAIRERPSFP